VLLDITDKIEFQQRLDQLSHHIPGVIYQYRLRADGTSHFPYSSDGIRDIYDVTPEEVKEDAAPVFKMIHPDDIERVSQTIVESANHLTPWYCEYRIGHQDGRINWVLGQSTPEKEPDGSIIWHGYITDISDRKQTEVQFQKLSQRLTLALESGAIGCWEWDINSNIIIWDERMYELYGVIKQSDTVVYDVWSHGIHPEDRRSTEKLLQQTVLGQAEYDTEFRVIHPNGSIHFIQAFGIVAKDSQGNPQSMIGVNFDITERKHTEKALAQAKEAAEAATKAKSEFLANMSHEIRTPMNGVLVMAQNLVNTPLNEEQKDLVQTIRDSGDALLVIINDILDFSKIESGKLQLETYPFAVKDIFKSVCNLLNKQALDKGINITYTINSDVPNHILGESSRLRQILLNLLGNALKFTQQGGISIIVSNNRQEAYSPAETELMISIQDTGIGIDSDLLAHLFQPFTQADASISRRYGGTGLGLAISNSLVGLMGGTIWVESQGNIGGTLPENWLKNHPDPYNQGSKFYFTLKAKAVSESEINPKTAPKPPQSEGNATPSQLKIILAEDNKTNQKVAMFTLKKSGYQADIASNGLEVLALLEKQFYDVTLMDMQMPEMDGITATKMIRKSSKPQPYIIAVTANALEEDRQICFNAGMNDFITKPIAIAELKRALSTIA
jgi:PAS domain S-box-containing protein